MSELFGRKYRIIVANKGTNGIDITGLRCVFKIEKSMSAEPNNSVVQIYNLSDNTQNTVLTTGKRIIIEAGYENSSQYGLIFDGDIIKSLKRKAGTDTITEIIAQDGDLFLNSGFISVSYAAGQTTKSVLSTMAGVGDKEITLGNVSDSLKGTKLARGKVLFGQPKDYAAKMANNEGALFYVNDRKINLVKPADLPTEQIVSLSPTSGLVGTPEQTDDGISGQCLLNPFLNLNKLLHIDNSYVQVSDDVKSGSLSSGVYKIIKLSFTGDTYGNEWYTYFDGIAQPGTVPLTGNSFSK